MRAGELGVRVALGVTRSRLLGQFLVESLILCVASGIVGLGIAFAFQQILLASVCAFESIFSLDQRFSNSACGDIRSVCARLAPINGMSPNANTTTVARSIAIAVSKRLS